MARLTRNSDVLDKDWFYHALSERYLFFFLEADMSSFRDTIRVFIRGSGRDWSANHIWKTDECRRQFATS